VSYTNIKIFLFFKDKGKNLARVIVGGASRHKKGCVEKNLCEFFPSYHIIVCGICVGANIKEELEEKGLLSWDEGEVKFSTQWNSRWDWMWKDSCAYFLEMAEKWDILGKILKMEGFYFTLDIFRLKLNLSFKTELILKNWTYSSELNLSFKTELIPQNWTYPSKLNLSLKTELILQNWTYPSKLNLSLKTELILQNWTYPSKLNLFFKTEFILQNWIYPSKLNLSFITELILHNWTHSSKLNLFFKTGFQFFFFSKKY